MARRDNRLAARALADWARGGFTNETAHHLSDTYRVSVRTLWRWKNALDDDSELSQLFRDRLNDALDQDWAAELDAALRETIARIRELLDDSTNLADLVAVFEKFSEVRITREVLGVAANADQDPAAAEASGDAAPRGALGPN